MHKINARRLLIAGLGMAGTYALATGIGAARAQTAPAQEAELPDEIVVTANRRSERLSDVPASVAGYDREKLDEQGIRDVGDLIAQTPGLSLIPQSSFQPPNIAVRGIQAIVGAATTGIYIDDTPIQTRNTNASEAGAPLPTIFDLERVEVLRGPQGTLFGAGSMGGTLRFITPVPDVSKTSIYARGELAATEHGDLSYEAGAAVGFPLIDGVAGLRLSGSYRRDGGYVDRVNDLTGAVADADSNRATTKTFKAILNLDLGKLRVVPSFNFQDMQLRDRDQYYPRLSRPEDGVLRSGRLLAQPMRDRFYLPALKVEAEIGTLTATSVTSYLVRRARSEVDFSTLDFGLYRLFSGQLPIPRQLPAAFTGAVSRTRSRQDNFTQEVRLQSDAGGPVSWLIGGFYQRNKQGFAARIEDPYYASFFAGFFGSPAIDGIVRYTTDGIYREEQLAGFANVDVRLGALTLTAGGRIADTRFSFREQLDGPFNRGPKSASGSQQDTPFTPRVSLSWKPEGGPLLYVSAAKGFRIGGANQGTQSTPLCNAALAQLGLSSAPTEYDSDSLWSYEAGAKAKLGKLRFEASVYHVDWNDIQSFVQLTGCATGFIANLGAARSNGFDLNVSAAPLPGLSLNAAVGYNRTRYARSVITNGVYLVEKGTVVSDVPPWQVTLTGEYATPIGSREGYVRLIHEYRSRNTGRFARFDNPQASGYDPTLRENDGFGETSARIGYRGKAIDASLFVNNLFDSRPQLNLIRNALPTDTNYYAQTIRPRTFGLTVTYRQ
ncbi:TonB-dependent receptor [Sphingomonas koreensis]